MRLRVTESCEIDWSLFSVLLSPSLSGPVLALGTRFQLSCAVYLLPFLALGRWLICSVGQVGRRRESRAGLWVRGGPAQLAAGPWWPRVPTRMLGKGNRGAVLKQSQARGASMVLRMKCFHLCPNCCWKEVRVADTLFCRVR